MGLGSLARSRLARWSAVGVAVILVVMALSGVAAGGTTADAGSALAVSCADNETSVSGTADFYYEPYQNHDPKYDGNYHPLRDVPVEIIYVNPIGENQTLASTRTDGRGDFGACLSQTDYDRDIVLRFAATNNAAEVYNKTPPIGGVLVERRSDVLTIEGNAASATLGRNYDDDGEMEVVPQGDNVAFHIVDSALTAQQFIASNTPDNWERLKIRYIYPDGPSGYSPGGPIKKNEKIFIGDNNFGRSQEIVWAEYAHAVEAAAYDYDKNNIPSSSRSFELPNGCHRPESETNTAFALSEGWSDYFAHYQGIGWDDDRTYYDATSGLCPPYDDDGTMDGFRVEGSVTSIFWDITDGGPNDDDQINKSFNTILSLFRDHQIQSMWDAYDHLQDDVNDTQALNEIFVTHGIDVEKPWASISGGLSQTTYAPETTLSGSTGDEHSNISRVQVRVDDGDWRTVAGDDANSWSFTRQYEQGTHTVELRATDHWGNNATYTYTVERKTGPPKFDGASGRAASIDDDPLLEDVDGNGEANIFDAITYYNNRDSAAVDAYPTLFDFDGDGTAGTVFDAIALYNEVSG